MLVPGQHDELAAGPSAERSDPVDMLELAFMQRAFMAAALVGLVAPLVGVFIVQRRMSLIGDGLGHVALAGVAAGLLFATSPLWTALAATIAGAVLVELAKRYSGASGDVAIAMLFYGGIAGGVVLLSQADSGSPANLHAYLFGSIVTTTSLDVKVFAALGVVIVLMILFAGPKLFAVSHDPEYSQAQGLPLHALNMLLAIVTATTVVLSMRVIGLLLISALIVIPVATAQVFAKSFVGTITMSVVLGLIISLGGTATAYHLNAPAGGTVVLLGIAIFALSSIAKGLFRAITSSRFKKQPNSTGQPDVATTSS